MCLDTITRHKVLKKDLIVKKIVLIGNNHNLYTGTLMGNIYRIWRGVNRAKICSLPTSKISKYYNSGFHCYPSKYNDNSILSMWNKFTNRIVVKFVIPQGTRVLYGIQKNMTVIVTPILIHKKEIR